MRPKKFSSIGQDLTKEIFAGRTYKTNKRKINKIAVHCSFSPQNRDDDAYIIDNWHRQRWGDSSGIGYHYIVLENGTIQKGRWVDAIGAHVKNYNKNTIGICRIGGMNKDSKAVFDATKEQIKSIKKLTKLLIDLYDLQVNDILGHNEFPYINKLCPLMDMNKIRKQ